MIVFMQSIVSGWDEMERLSLWTQYFGLNFSFATCVWAQEAGKDQRFSFLAHKSTYVFSSHLHTIATLIFPKHDFVKDIPTLKNLLLDFKSNPQYGLQPNDSNFLLVPQQICIFTDFALPYSNEALILFPALFDSDRAARNTLPPICT